ncbi:hypothetical protein PanWU01x14_023480, partial [Parasponia andersonii]
LTPWTETFSLPRLSTLQFVGVHLTLLRYHSSNQDLMLRRVFRVFFFLVIMSRGNASDRDPLCGLIELVMAFQITAHSMRQIGRSSDGGGSNDGDV